VTAVFARGRYFGRITAPCVRRGKGEFAAFGGIKRYYARTRAPFSAGCDRDKLIAGE